MIKSLINSIKILNQNQLKGFIFLVVIIIFSTLLETFKHWFDHTFASYYFINR